MISVIIPNYNQQKYIRDALQSVFTQTHRDFEVIVIDDGSTDESKKIIDEYGDEVRYIWQENKGLAGARNTGIKAARGEFVAFLDADDIWLPTYLETMQQLIAQHPEGTLYYCGAQCIDNEGNRLPQIVGQPIPAGTNPEAMYQFLLRSNFLIPSTITVRRDVLLDAGLFDEALRYCEDIDLWLRIAADHVFVGTASSHVLYRIHSSSLSTNPQKTQETKFRVIEKYFGPDDANWGGWSADKKRAFGGAYRFQTITFIQNADDWNSASESLRKAILADPTLSTDIDFFYELALGGQSKGLRTQANQGLIENNARHLDTLLAAAFSPDQVDTAPYKRETVGNAYFALGLLAYNNGHHRLARKFLSKSFANNPRGSLNARFLGTALRAMLGSRLINFFKNVRGRQSENEQTNAPLNNR
jgi:glycosyltransferase involved in cell wall biosynthesis